MDKRYNRPKFYGFQTPSININDVRAEPRNLDNPPEKKVSFSTGVQPEMKTGKDRMFQLPSYPKFVKGYALANNMEYKEALKSPSVKAMYRKTYDIGETGVVSQLKSSFIEKPRPKIIPENIGNDNKIIYIDERMNDKNSIFKPTNVAKKIEEQSELQASRNLYNDLKQIFFNGFLRSNPKFVKDFTSSHNSNNFKPLSEKLLNAMLNMMLNKSESKIFEISPFSEIAIARVLNPDIASKFNSNNIILTEQSLSKEQGIIVDRLHPHYNIVLPKSSIPLIKDNDTFYLNTSAINTLLNIFLPEIVINKEKMNYNI